MKRRNDNHSPGLLIRELVPSSHQRSELSNTILCIFSGWDQRIGEGIPIPDSLGEDATFINICIGNGVWNAIECWFLQRLVLGIRSSVGTLALPLRPLYLGTTVLHYQDQDSLLVKRRNDNHSPGPVIRELVPSSHQRSELSNTILCIFSGWDQRIGEGIPIPDSLGEEATFINICTGNGVWNAIEFWFLQRLVLGIRSSVGTLALPLRPLYSNITLLSFLLFLRDSHFNCPRMPVILPLS